MTIADRITQARHDRAARRAARAGLQQLTRELAAYSTPADRLEIELLASRSTAPGAELVLSILDGMRVRQTNTDASRLG
ncbi:MAG: hypothetical protein ABIR83_13895 [Nakamurella sp.]